MSEKGFPLSAAAADTHSGVLARMLAGVGRPAGPAGKPAWLWRPLGARPQPCQARPVTVTLILVRQPTPRESLGRDRHI